MFRLYFDPAVPQYTRRWLRTIVRPLFKLVGVQHEIHILVSNTLDLRFDQSMGPLLFDWGVRDCALGAYAMTCPRQIWLAGRKPPGWSREQFRRDVLQTLVHELVHYEQHRDTPRSRRVKLHHRGMNRRVTNLMRRFEEQRCAA